MMAEPSFRRCDNELRGRHLRSTRCIRKDELVFCERPLLSLQSIGNSNTGALVCRNCRAFVGGPDLSLAVASGRVSRAQAYSYWKGCNAKHNLVECRQNCGELYCSTKCQQDHWSCGGHELLCTGKLPDSEIPHPLIEFKFHAIQNNEIFLMVADLVAAVVSQRSRQIRQQKSLLENSETASAAASELLKPYLDFTLVPWWTVATTPLVNSSTDFAEASELDKTLRRICDESSLLLKRALVEDNSVAKQALQDLPDICSGDFFGKIIGSFEQNAIGIRRRHPLCRDIFDEELRCANRLDLIKCMEKVGMIEDKEGEDGVLENNEHSENECSSSEQDNEEKWDYSEDEIASFLAELCINEGPNRMNQTENEDEDEEDPDFEGDDLDALFTPLDGTAMYSTTCKMNHSCSPNVAVGYKTRGWGSDHPLVQHCIALRDIDPDEELCISYIESEEPFDARQEAIANYGFVCTCDKCRAEMDSSAGDLLTSQSEDGNEIDNDDLFGSDDEETDEDAEESEIAEITTEVESGERMLQDRLVSLNKSFNSISSIPMLIHAEAANFVLRVGSQAFEFVKKEEDPDSNIVQSFSKLLKCVHERDFVGCQEAGSATEKLLFHILNETGSWPFVEYRECFGCAAVVAAIGYAHEGNFITAQRMLDRALILGLPRKNIRHFFDFVEIHAIQASNSPTPPTMKCTVPEYNEDNKDILQKSLSQPIRHNIEESPLIEEDIFLSEYVSKSKPLVFRGLARQWPATNKWRHLHNFAHEYGHRSVPIELGSMMNSSGMKEQIMAFGEFFLSFLFPSSKKEVWTLQNASEDSSEIGYLAQHPLLDQIPSLTKDVDLKPSLCGKAGPYNFNIWLGTGGTRTPLHFDSYDNLFVQIVGAKYVRIYSSAESENLYVIRDASKSSTNLQGNMSEVDCELEEFDSKHPKARNAKFVEVLLLPGDALFIPARSWHYVRSLSTSISVNYWF